MGRLKKACRQARKWFGLGKRRACRGEERDDHCSLEPFSTTSISSLPGAAGSRSPMARSEVCRGPVEVHLSLAVELSSSLVAEREKIAAAGSWNVSSESDSGVDLGADYEGESGGYPDWCEEGEEGEEGEECECEECALERCEDGLEDWQIAAKDLNLEKKLSRRSTESVYSGYWHGSVIVHQRHSPVQRDLDLYLREAHTLSKIRHESVQLFLGVCLNLQPNSVAIVMSNVKGESLHSLLHWKGQELQFAAMTKYLNQIAQGMAYLHDRGIAHPLLTSKSITINYRACISMLSPAPGSSRVEASNLVYIPAEVIRSLAPYNRHSFSLATDHTHHTPAVNIFSFGTIVYEMVNLSRPFASVPGELIIWEVGNGRSQSLQHMNSGKLRDLIRRCWVPSPGMRPSFKELMVTLEQNMSPRSCGLNSYFSFSDPGRLETIGLH